MLIQQWECKLKVNSGPTLSGATTYFMVAFTSSLDELVNAIKKLCGYPIRSRGEFAFNLGVANQSLTYSINGNIIII